MSAFLADRIGAITQQNGGFGAIFIVFAGLFTFALAMAFVLMRERCLQAN